MSKQSTSDLRFAGSADGDLVPVPALSSSFTVAFTTASVATTGTIATETGLSQPHVFLRITADTDCFITTAVAPTALSDGSHHFMVAGLPQDIKVPSRYKLAAIGKASAGNLYATALV